MMNELGQEGWTLERASWEELQSLVDLLNQAVEVTPDWVELRALHQDAGTKMLQRACPACLQKMLIDDPYDPDPFIDDPHAVGEPKVMLRQPHKSGLLYLPEKNGIIYRPGCVLVCETCADTRTVGTEESFSDDHPLVGCSWRAAWSICNVIIVNDGGGWIDRYHNQTLAEAIARVRAASDWTEEEVQISNFHATVFVSVASRLGRNPELGDEGLRDQGLLELAPAFFHLQAEGVDTQALRGPASEWLQAADDMGHSLWASEILNQVAEAVRTEDLHLLKDHMAVGLHSHLWDTGKAVKWLRAMIADTLTLTPEGYHSRFGYV